MRRVPPSTVIREELDRLLAGGVDEERNVVSDVLKLALRSVVQQALEQEQSDFLGRGHYERGSEHRGHRNGYEDATLRTAEGGVEVRTPQVRGSAQPFRPKLLEFLDGNSSALERLVVEMYARGLSVRDVEEPSATPYQASCSSPEAPSRRSPMRCGRSTRPSAPATSPTSTSATCS